MFKWKVKFYTLFWETKKTKEVEIYKAWTKKGVHKQFLRRYGNEMPDSLIHKYNFLRLKPFKKMVTFIGM